MTMKKKSEGEKIKELISVKVQYSTDREEKSII